MVSADHGDELGVPDFRIGRWARLFCTVSLVGAGVLLIAVAAAHPRPAGASPVGVGGDRSAVRVTAGDTLWSIAERVDPDADPRAVVDRIEQLNGLSSDALVAGVILQVPLH